MLFTNIIIRISKFTAPLNKYIVLHLLINIPHKYYFKYNCHILSFLLNLYRNIHPSNKHFALLQKPKIYGKTQQIFVIL